MGLSDVETVPDVHGRRRPVHPLTLADVRRLQARFGPLDKLDFATAASSFALAMAAAALHLTEDEVAENFSLMALREVFRCITRQTTLGPASEWPADLPL